jgi:hypothetical protein
MRRILLIFPAFFVGLFLFGNFCFAANSDIIINEIGAYELTDHEWIEIYNSGSGPIDITGWKFFENNTNHGLNLYQGDDMIIESGEYVIIADVGENFVADYPSFSGTIIDSAWSNLNESGELIELRTSSDPASVIESFTYISVSSFSLERANPLFDNYSASNWQEHSSGNTAGYQNSNYDLPLPNIFPIAEAGIDQDVEVGEIVHFDGSGSSDGDGSIIDYQWDFGDGNSDSGINVNNTFLIESIITVWLTVTDNNGATSSDSLLVTVTVPVSAPTSTPESGDIIINEIVSDANTEWIELYNNTTTTIGLSEFSIEDGIGTIGGLTGEILGNDFYVFELPSSKLNNAGDIVILRYDTTIFDFVVYGNWDDGNISDNFSAVASPNSLARDGNVFLETITPTKGALNVITADTPSVQPQPQPQGSGGGVVIHEILSYNLSDVVINELVCSQSYLDLALELR